jgi:membrane protein YdbS with pleckstrin-like domain
MILGIIVWLLIPGIVARQLWHHRHWRWMVGFLVTYGMLFVVLPVIAVAYP